MSYFGQPASEPRDQMVEIIYTNGNTATLGPMPVSEVELVQERYKRNSEVQVVLVRKV